MTRPRLLDLFCGAGGAAMGYHRAGFDVIGVDSEAKVGRHYPFEFIHADATTFPLDGFDAIHASPPCKDWTVARIPHRKNGAHGTGWMLPETRRRLLAQPAPWVIENVPGAEMRVDFRLCGCMFDLPGLRRERWFETSWHAFDLRSPCYHTGQTVTVAGHGVQSREHRLGIKIPQSVREEAMGIDWMNRDELAQAIPPAYTEFIGEQLLAHLAERAA
ncbi:MAG TPA: DNA cytosine methyltransferase [Acidimicrobiales bacterium]|nr:DNA cytosine methyltransferase [Acidimicrobiales bacterium]